MALPVWLSSCLLVAKMVRQKRDRFGIDEKRRKLATHPSPPTEALEDTKSSRVAYEEVENHSGDVRGPGGQGDNGGTPGAVTVKEEAAESFPSGSEEVEEEMWTEDRENSLIELYKNCTFLYDKTLPSYKLKHKKHAAFNKFGVILGIPGRPHDVPPFAKEINSIADKIAR